jgi:hypothetical protein
METRSVGAALGLGYFLECDLPRREYAHLGRCGKVLGRARAQIKRHTLGPLAKEIVAEGNVRHRDFVSASSEVAEYKAIRLATCNGLPVDHVVGLDRKPNRGAAIDYKSSRLCGNRSRKYISTRGTRRGAARKKCEPECRAGNPQHGGFNFVSYATSHSYPLLQGCQLDQDVDVVARELCGWTYGRDGSVCATRARGMTTTVPARAKC